MQARLVSGIKPTGDLTLGNYLGAIKKFIKLQNNFESYIFVADLHALTDSQMSAKELKENRRKIIALYLASGLDPQKVNIFYQSAVLEHGFIQWLCLCETTIGELNRMTQFKDKTEKFKQGNNTYKIPSGILAYPTLMAGDILLYNPEIVPVGQDQTQHLELTRNIAERFNSKYKTKFNVPKPLLNEVGTKIMSLQNPDKKMSKSEGSQKATIYLLEDPQSAYNKILKAVTDSENKVYLSDEKKGVKNLLNIYAAINDLSLEEAAEKFRDSNYKEFKEAVAESVKALLENLQSKYNDYLKKVDEIASSGASKAKKLAQKTILELKEKMGLN